MKEEKRRIVVTVLTVMLLIIIFSGVTYAYFTATNNQGSTSLIKVNSGKMIITYNDGTDDIKPVTDIIPTNAILVNKTFSLTGTNTTTGITTGDGLVMPYKVGLKYTSTFSDDMLYYYIKEVNRVSTSKVVVEYTGEENQTVQGNETYTGYSKGTLKKGNRYTEMVTGEFPASDKDQTITFNLKIQFPDNNDNQDSEKGKTINGKIVINEPTISEYIASLDQTENGLEIDDTADKNIRYVGASPKNYLTFNNETWRIIGVFNNITTIDENGNEKKESLVKIIRDERLGSYSWDSSSSDKNDGRGINEWSQADLMYELNCDGTSSSKYCRDDITEGYLSDKTSGTAKWYNGQNNTQSGIYYFNRSIKKSELNKIAVVRWNLGGASTGLSTLNSYNQERGTSHVSNPSDNVLRTNTWDGKIALIYPSDCGYASTDSLCRSDMSSQSNNIYNCQNDNWLFNSTWQWTLTSHSNKVQSVFAFSQTGWVVDTTAGNGGGIRPSLYLKSNVVISSGEGTSDNPYILD